MKKRLVVAMLAVMLGISTVACSRDSFSKSSDADKADEEVLDDEEDADDKEAEDEETEDPKDEDKSEEVPHAEENIDIGETELANDSMIAGWDVAKQPENEVDNRTNISLSNMKKIGLKALPDDSMGMVYLAPNKSGTGRDMLFGTRELVMYFQREDVKPGSGTISVFREEDDLPICSVNVKQSVKSYGADDETFGLLGWETGTRVVITLPFPLDHSERFYVTADAGAFKADTDNGKVESKAIKKGAWTFDVAEYGVIPQLPSGSNVYVGGSMDIAFYIQGRCKKAVISSFDENRVRFSKTEIREAKKIEAKFYQIGQDDCIVTFYDNDDNILGQTRLIYMADMDPAGELNPADDKNEDDSEDNDNILDL